MSATSLPLASAGEAEPMVEGLWPSLLLSFVGGYVDTFSFVTLFGLFTAHVTGNFVLIGAALAGHSHAGIIGKLLALPTFIVGVAATRWFQQRREHRPLAAARVLVVAQLAGLLVFMGLGLIAGPFADADAPGAIVVGLVGVAAMAIQNAAARSAFVRLSPTTVMTGNVTQVTMDLVDLLQGRLDSAAVDVRIAKLWPPIVAFALGAIAAGVLCGRCGFEALLFPTVALLALWWRLRPGANPARS